MRDEDEVWINHLKSAIKEMELADDCRTSR